MGLTGSVLITGGSGTLGQAILAVAARESWDARFTILSRSESRQAAMRAAFPQARYILGDVRDRAHVATAIAGADTVIHAAAMKRIPECEQQPDRCIETNVIGTSNVAQACLEYGVRTAVFISTDKACRAITHYGASKLMGETIWRAAAQQSRHTRFVGVRYGNVIDSTGSVIPFWRDQLARGEPLTLTDERMTRFWMTPDDAVETILYAANDTRPGAIFVPKLRSMAIVEMARALFGNDVAFHTTGLRSLEKMFEDLVHPEELAIEYPTHYVLLSGSGGLGYGYTSATCKRILPETFRAMVASVESEAAHA